VTERGRPIAKLTPAAVSALLPQNLAELEKQGIIKIGTGKLPKNFWSLPRPKDPKGLVLNVAAGERGRSVIARRLFLCASTNPRLLQSNRFLPRIPLSLFGGRPVPSASRLSCAKPREGNLASADERRARDLLETLSNTRIEIQPTTRLRAVAERLLAVHPL
jgi:hypothetical protein